MLHPYICNADAISTKTHNLLQNRYPEGVNDFVRLIINTRNEAFTSVVSGGALTMSPKSAVSLGTGGCYLTLPAKDIARRLYSSGNTVSLSIDATVFGLPEASGGGGDGGSSSTPAAVTMFSTATQNSAGEITSSRMPIATGVTTNGRFTFLATFGFSDGQSSLVCSVSSGDTIASSVRFSGDSYPAGVEFGHFGDTTLYRSGGRLSIHEFKVIANLANDYDPFDESKQCTSDRWFALYPRSENTWHFDGDYRLNGARYPL